MAEWVALRPILEVCDTDKVFKGGGRRREQWWRQTLTRKQLSAMLKEISSASRERCWIYVRCGRGGGNREAADLEDGAGRDRYQYARKTTGDS